MNDIDLDAIKARLAAIGDRWIADPDGAHPAQHVISPGTDVTPILTDEGSGGFNGSVVALVPRWAEPGSTVETLSHAVDSDAAVRFIAHAPRDLAALVAENERLRAVVERLRAVADAVRKYLSTDAAMQSDPSALSVRIAAFDRWQSARTAAYAALDALDGGEGE